MLTWSAYQLSSEPPRVIITLAKHRNEASTQFPLGMAATDVSRRICGQLIDST